MLEGKIVFVSGGSGYLGSAICETCAHYGAKVYFSYNKNEEEANALMERIEGSKGIKINLKDVNDINEKIGQLHKEIEQFDILVNNAGVSQVMPFAMLEENDLDFMLDINVKGAVFLTKAVMRRMIKNRKGAIVNIGSIAGHRLLDVPVHYAVTKAAISGLTCSLAPHLKKYGVRVNSVVPGLLEDGVARGVPDANVEDYNDHCAVGRVGTAREVAEVVCFLASDRASYVNGQNIFVDGGL
jgi:NAD(P)-dependent dehydrogenase (short-subunit alcohol dehydrogenase family)